ncbi:MAG: histidine phosphatase family protein [Cypionkella sp.]
MTSQPEGQPSLRIYFIRHGETAWSLSGQHTGRSDLSLTKHGQEQASELAPWLAATHFAHVLTSPRLRARQTCDLSALGTAAEIEPALAEWDYGDYEGLRSEDIRKAHPGWNIFQDGCAGGEMPQQISDRADRLIVRLRQLTGNVALFSHGQFGAVFGARWTRLPIIAGQHLLLHPASVSILGDSPRHAHVPVIELWNALPPGRSATFGLTG